jgi:hypothetical protein
MSKIGSLLSPGKQNQRPKCRLDMVEPLTWQRESRKAENEGTVPIITCSELISQGASLSFRKSGLVFSERSVTCQ